MRAAFAAAYFFSALAALSLEMLWIRALALRLGSTALANALVLGSFMAGLAVGALVAGWWARKDRHPARTFGLAQWLGAGLAWLPMATWIHDPWTAAGLVLLASAPLGACFALAGVSRANDGSKRGAGLGRLWALDAAGAAAGVLLTGLFGIWLFGMQACLLLATGIKVAAGCIGLLQDRLQNNLQDRLQNNLQDHLQASPQDQIRPGPTSSPPQTTQRHRPAWPLLMTAMALGFSILGAELLWSRLLSFTLYRGSTTFAMATMLASVLLASAAGARWASQAAKKETSHGRARMSALLASLCLLSSLALLLLAEPVPGEAVLTPIDLLLTLAVCAPAAFFSGAVFASLCAAAKSDAGSTAGWMLGANAIGAMFGAFLAPLVLVPILGLGWSLMALAALPWAASWILEDGPARSRWPRWFLRAGLLPLGLALGLAGPTWTRHLGKVLFYHEGPDASVAVVEDPPGIKRLFVDGIAVAGTDLALATDQQMLAHLPVMLHGHVKQALTVGFGAGGTSQALLKHPALEVDCVEIAEGVPLAAPWLTEVNGGLPTRPEARFHLHMADARRFLEQSDKRWDLILNDCTDLAYRSDASLYTQEFFTQIAAHLHPQGLAVVWVPLRGQLPHPSLQAVVAAFTKVFPQSSLWVFDAFPTHFGLLMGSQRPLTPSCKSFQMQAWPKEVRSDLEGLGLADPTRLLSSMHLDDKALRAFASGALAHSDDRPVAEYLAAMDSADDASTYEPQPAPLRVSCQDPKMRHQLGLRLAARPWLLAGHQAWSADDPKTARRMIIGALRQDPSDPLLRQLLGMQDLGPGLQQLMANEPLTAAETLRKAPSSPERDYLLALALLDSGQPKKALPLIKELASHLPRSPWAIARWRATLPGPLSACTSALTLPSL
ncbi:MAG: fused MFS/spermidine synthase [Deltaproteobacteria bacterium]|nr:fused MFS/spermidine synthase [Deltaproteobacteria bacterium]